jgi:hypothetical protein
MEKIKDSNVRHVILDCLHMVMFMSINLYETINDFKACGRELVMESFYKYNLVLLGQNTFGFIIVNLVSKGSPFQVWHVLKPYCYGCITWMHVQFSHIQITSWVGSMLWMSLQSFGWLGFVGCPIQIKTHKLALSLITGL